MNKLFIIIHICLIFVLAYVGADFFYKAVLPAELFMQAPVKTQRIILKNTGNRVQGKISSDIKRDPEKVLARNLFQVATDPSVETKEPSDSQELENLEPTRLEVSLWGTITGQDTLLAVIEDKKTRRQALYQQGDEVQNAQIKKIFRHAVVLTLNGDDQLLEMEEERQSFDLMKDRIILEEDSYPLLMEEAIMGQDSIPVSVNDVKLRPYFLEDRMNGVMLYAIHPDSPFKKIGLRNGDIVTSVDGKEISGSQNTEQLLLDLTKEGPTSIRFLRGGQERQLVYVNHDGEFRADSLDAKPHGE